MCKFELMISPRYTNCMKKLAIILLLLPGVGLVQSKPPTVVKPQYDNYGSQLNYANDINVILQGLVVSSTTDIVTKEEIVDTEIEITTEIGSTTISLDTSTSSVELEKTRLSNVVERINQDYEVAEQECRNGSWLERVWCSFMAWF